MINYSIIALVILILVVLLWLFLKKNKKDKKSLSETLNANETQPDEHDQAK